MTPAAQARPAVVSAIRDTSAQDRPIDPEIVRGRHRRRVLAIGGAGVLLLLAIVAVARSWLSAEMSVPAERVRIAEVGRGFFIRDVAAQGTVVAARSPTLFAPATGTVHYLVSAGDKVSKDQTLAQVESPELHNELQREQATLASLEVELQRQSIETRRRLLENQQAIDLANVAIQAAERERRRADDSWGKRLISERDYEKARDDAAAAAVNHKHAIEAAQLQKESLEFELRAKRLERDRQRLLVEDLERRVAGLDIKSPVDGVVGTLIVAERTNVAQNAPLLTVVDLGAFEMPETYGDDLSIGMEAEVAYGGRAFSATVSAVSPEVREGQIAGRLRFAREVPQGMRQNQRVSARIVLEARDGVLKVQRGPFLESGGASVAYVVEGDIATRRKIRIGGTSIAEVEILEGLDAGDRIIVSGLGELDRVERLRLD
jgi:HlyD family secretion protein